MDKKVNPDGFRAGKEGRPPEYVVNSNVRYLANWFGIRQWMQEPEICAHFDVIVADRKKPLRDASERRALRLKTTPVAAACEMCQGGVFPVSFLKASCASGNREFNGTRRASDASSYPPP